ncbi:MAG: GGDEF domain-containing protein [Gammaproteobacteria bacterium]|nr:GGDEF domain-containing protein [Gammaproteobacteria bacterium]MBT3723067.1 GGDEF domain-containing protein [Gammaproteobacteria bacterium]MBT4450515.1 GGDEF domain-containing protein [Gammaproteobacteria bacterium]MBT4861266.1 GGDEF domain-containing protein [Gammaproteobacteria bacterium]MBT6551226.1 GGDEF domain-containing protein [Gammaproteobacteria bacterium]
MLFHTLVELFSILVAVLLSIVVWQTYPVSKNHFLMYLGSGYLWVAVLDFIHTIAYKGMNLVAISNANSATQFWISSRYLEAFILISAPIFLTRSIRRELAIPIFGVVAGGIMILILTGNFPDAFIEGKGLTSFKIYSEYLIIALLASSLVFLWNQKNHIDNYILNLMVAAIILTMIAELAFTFYVSVYGVSNLVGHFFKFFSYWLLYEAVVHTSLKQPIKLLRQDLKKEIHDRKLLEKELIYQVSHDSLTGLNSRAMLEERVIEELNRAVRYKHELSVFFLDIDHFKSINDQYGHHVGDIVLGSLARIMKREVRKSDIVARFGGEEFVVLLPETSLDKARELAERLCTSVELETIKFEDEGEVNLTVSIGVATFPAHGLTWPKLLDIADASMYKAKKGGRNQVVVASDDQN